MLYVFLALAGWVGGGWAASFGGERGLYTQDQWPIPWPPCLVCGGLLGLIASVVLWALLPQIAADLPIGPHGWGELAAFGLVVGAAAGLALNVGHRLFRGKGPAAR
jgi:hypothetical protein